MYYIYTGARKIVGENLAGYLYPDPPAEVIPGIYIGSTASVREAAKYGINYIINLSGEDSHRGDIYTTYINFPDTTMTPQNASMIMDAAERAVGAIRATRDKKILVHCAAGVNRSAFVIALYLISLGYDYDNTIKLLTTASQTRRVPVLTNNSFKTYLLLLSRKQE